jgi:hypothetical protein
MHPYFMENENTPHLTNGVLAVYFWFRRDWESRKGIDQVWARGRTSPRFNPRVPDRLPSLLWENTTPGR